MITDIEMLKWLLNELINQDEIESNEIEVYVETEDGQEGFATAKITDIAENALKRIEALEITLKKCAHYAS